MAKHWMDDVADDIRERMRLMLPAVSAAVNGSVPFQYKPPNRTDEVAKFLKMSHEDRVKMAIEMSPEEWKEYTGTMMTEMVKRFGPAASAVTSLLQMTEVDAMEESPDYEVAQTGLAGLASARAELQELLGGVDPTVVRP